ncbi:MAG: serine hydrolase [Candidatus Dormibacteraeota bacterium]|nr:serine hydrolase [Candidatus Dormibacteraeota bacterium]
MPSSTVQRYRRRPQATRRDWIIAVSVALLLVITTILVLTVPKLRSAGPQLGVDSAQAGATGGTAAAVRQAPFLEWDYVWGLSHPAVGAPKAQARSELMVDLDNRHVLYARDPKVRLPMASTTKLMTAMVALDNASLDSVVSVPDDTTKVEPDHMGLSAGERVRVGDLLFGLLLDSGNDAAETLAMTTFESRDAFIKAMNDKADALGLQDTHFANPSGLDDPAQYSTAQDLALVAAYIYQHYPAIEQVVTAKSQGISGNADHKAFLPTNFNKLLWSYPGAIGFKTGQTDNAGTCLVTGAKRGNQTLLLVELNDPMVFTNATTMLNYGFQRPG